ncbi:MAG: hypothetical protein JSS53_04775, partial [Proteobacteria bacterium]|nr:hypothetical protein [Pseudomonadota bacterium]
MKNLLLLPCVILLSSCVSQLSAPQCANMDWHEQGYKDASFGMSPGDLSRASQLCAGYNIPGKEHLIPPVNKEAYQAGWRKG